MSTPAPRRLLVVLEARPGAHGALDHAIALAGTEQAELLIASVVQAVMPFIGHPMTLTDALPDAVERAARDAARAAADAALEGARAAGLTARATVVAATDACRTLARTAEREGCAVIVVATEGRHAWLRLLDGSLVPGLVSEATVPVLVCRAAAAAGRGGLRRRRHRHAAQPARGRATLQYT